MILMATKIKKGAVDAPCQYLPKEDNPMVLLCETHGPTHRVVLYFREQALSALRKAGYLKPGITY